MSFLSRFPERVRTVIIWAPIPLIMVIWSPQLSWIIFTLLALIGTMEWRWIVMQRRDRYFTRNSQIALLGVILSMVITLYSSVFGFVLSGFFAILVYVNETSRQRIMLALAQIVPTFVGIMAYLVRAGEDGLAMLGLVLIITTFSDTAAYFVGKAIGKHKFAPTISPNKTWEGAIGGWVFAIIGAWIYAAFFVPSINALNPFLKLICFWLLAFAGQLGDLAESALKRRFKVKDSGTIFPGHGGVLDRFDSFAAVISIIFIMQIFLI